MDSLYDNLENYDDANALEELKRENQELKLKLEEKDVAMQKLQKCIFQEFDILGAGFKQMQMNYSSLLKTAREEIKRKTEHINQLNLDKDAMVLKSLQNGNMRWKFRRQGLVGKNKSLNREVTNKNPKPNKEDKKDDVIGPKTERHDNYVTPKDAPAIVSSNNSNSSNSTVKTHNTNPPISAETQNKKNDKPKVPLLDTPKPKSIKDRRKSMPVLESMYDENHYETPERRYLDRFTDKNSYRTSETFSVDDRHYNRHEMRESYRGNPGRHYEIDKYRGRDKYNDVPHRPKFHHSPEMLQRRPDNYIENYHKPEQRHRVLVSPPPDTSTRYQRRNQDYRFNYDRYPNDVEKARYQDQERNAVKHKIMSDYEEPHIKRQKFDHCDKPVSNVDKKWTSYNDKWMKEAVSEPSFRTSPLESGEIVDSCQSPDIRHTEAVSNHAVREIKHTAAVQLQDPRLVSNKYLLKTESGKTTLITTESRNIKIKSVDKSLWNSPKAKHPDALKKKPLLLSEDYVKNIYMDIDNPKSYLSPETDSIENNGALDNYNHDKHAVQSDTTNKEMSIQNVLPEKLPLINVVESQKPMTYRKTVIGSVQTNTKENKTYEIDDKICKIDSKTSQIDNKTCQTDYKTSQIDNKTCQADDKTSQIENNTCQAGNKTSQIENKTCQIDVEIKKVKHKIVDKSTKNASKSSIQLQCSQEKIVTNTEETNSEKSFKDKQIVSESDQDKNVILTENTSLKKSAKNKHTTKQSRQTTKLKNNKSNIVVDVTCSETDLDNSAVSNVKPYNASLPIIASDITDISKHRKEKDSSHVTDKNIDVVDSKTAPPSKTPKSFSNLGEKLENLALRKSNIALVEGDLELSDENSDFVDTSSKLCTEIPKNKPKTKSSSKSSTKSTEKSISLSNENTSEIKNGKKEKAKDSDTNQKHKSKKKKSKQKEQDSKDPADDTIKGLSKIDKKLRMKMESEETRIKMGEIFGDSSLITPEDLGFPICGPPLDDAQDAVDIDIRVSNELGPENSGNKEIPVENNANINTKAECNLIQNKEILDMSSNVDTTLNKIAYAIKHSEIASNDLPPNIVYENLNSEDKASEKDVVVIISTGVQPQFISATNNEIVNRHIQIEPVSTQHVASIQEANQFDSNALATSTPQKGYTESKVDETAFSNDTGLKSAVENNTATNLQDDAPDVRIFVKRRRKVIKKSPKT